MTSAMAKLESAAGEGDKARTAAERLRAQVTGLQERNDKYKEVGRDTFSSLAWSRAGSIPIPGKRESILFCHL